MENLGSFLVLIFFSFFSSFFSLFPWHLFFSQFEEKFEEMNGTPPPLSFPLASSSGSNENPSTEVFIADSSGKELEPQDGYQMCSDLTASQEFIGGIMKIVPDIDVSFVFWVILWKYDVKVLFWFVRCTVLDTALYFSLYWGWALSMMP